MRHPPPRQGVWKTKPLAERERTQRCGVRKSRARRGKYPKAQRVYAASLNPNEFKVLRFVGAEVSKVIDR